MTARIAEHFADARCADARIHLDEVRSAGKQERRLRFAGDRSRQQRLAGSRRSDEQHALRNASTDRREPLGLAEEVDNLLHFCLGLVDPGDVVERHRRRLRIGFARLALQRRNASRRHAIQGEAEQADEADAEHQRAVAVRALFARGPHIEPHVAARELRHERRIARHVVGRRRRPKRLTAPQLEVERVAVDDHFGQRTAVEMLQQVGKRHLRYLRAAPRTQQGDSRNQNEHGDGRTNDGAAGPLATKHVTLQCFATGPPKADTTYQVVVSSSGCVRNLRGGRGNVFTS